MSKKGCDKIQAMQQEEPPLSKRIGAAMEAIVGEPVEFFMAFFTRDDTGRVLVSTAAMIEEDIMENLPRLVIQAMARHAAGQGFTGVQIVDETKH